MKNNVNTGFMLFPGACAFVHIYYFVIYLLHAVNPFLPQIDIMNLVKKITNLTSLNTEVKNHDGNKNSCS